MSRKSKQTFVILALVALIGFSIWPIYSKWRTFKAVSAAIEQRTRAVVEKNPQLKPAFESAMQDGTLTWAEAKEILERAGEKLEADE